MDSYNYRKQDRTSEEFRNNLNQKLEEKYVNDFIGAYIDRAKHKRYMYMDWGNIDKEIDQKGNRHKFWNRPDYLLIKKKDVSQKVDYICPLEVSTSRNKLIYYHIPKHKIRYYVDIILDVLTQKITTKKCKILFVNNTSKPGYEEFSLLEPKFLEKLKDRPLEKCFVNKLGYRFYHNEVKWKSFNGRTKQKNLEIGEK